MVLNCEANDGRCFPNSDNFPNACAVKTGGGHGEVIKCERNKMARDVHCLAEERLDNSTSQRAA